MIAYIMLTTKISPHKSITGKCLLSTFSSSSRMHLTNRRKSAILKEPNQSNIVTERYISDALDALGAINIYAVSAPIPSVTTSKGNRHRALPDIILYPSDEEQFKNELLRTKKAHFVLTYQSGVIKTSPWMADRFDITSNLRANIQSKPFRRKKTQEGLLKVEVHID